MSTYAILLIIAALIAAIIFWFLYTLAHPHPGEPRLIYNFRRHPSAIPEYLALLAYGLFHPHLLRTGSTFEERRKPLPGDDLVPKPQFQETRAKTIDVPVHVLWSWIVQVGGGRGGWYWWTPGEAFPEYDRYVIRTYEILPQFQHLEVGDRVSDGGPNVTEQRGNWVVKAVEPSRHLVLFAARQVSGGSDFDLDQRKQEGTWFISGWSFVLEPLGPEQTRLLVRVRAIGGPAWLLWFIRHILGKGDTVAHSSMLERIKSRSELLYQKSLAQSSLNS